MNWECCIVDIILGFIWDIIIVLMIYDYWVWAQSQGSKLSIETFWESIFKNLLNKIPGNLQKMFVNNETEINYWIRLLIFHDNR